MIKVSFIIPNYNSGLLLKRCVMSILSSESKDFEIIVVDDGSSDRSTLYVSGLDNRIRIIKQTNKGVSVARNNGIKVASGRYLAFVDSDDTLIKNWDKYIFNDIDYNADLCIYNYLNNNTKYAINHSSQLLRDNELSLFKIGIVKNPTKYLTVWGKLFKRSVIKTNKLSFDEHLRLAEDGDFMIQYLICSRSVYTSTHYFYHYQNNPDSVMRTFDTHKVDDYLNALVTTKNKIPSSSIIKPVYSYYVLMHLNVMMVHEVFDIGNNINFQKKVKRLINIVNLPIIKSSLKEIHFRDCSSSRMIPILLLKLHQYRLAGIIFKFRSIYNHKK